MSITAAALFVVVVAVPAKEPANLANGDVQIGTRKIDGSPIPEATAKAVIDGPPELVWSIVSDCANYKTTMPNIADSKLVSDEKPSPKDGPAAVLVRRCRVVADLPFPFPDLVSVTRGVNSVVPGKKWSRVWTFEQGDYVANEGKWQVEPFGDDGKRSLVTYVIHAQPKIFLPDSLVATIEEDRLPEMMRNIRKKVAAARPSWRPAAVPAESAKVAQEPAAQP